MFNNVFPKIVLFIRPRYCGKIW